MNHGICLGLKFGWDDGWTHGCDHGLNHGLNHGLDLGCDYRLSNDSWYLWSIDFLSNFWTHLGIDTSLWVLMNICFKGDRGNFFLVELGDCRVGIFFNQGGQ